MSKKFEIYDPDLSELYGISKPQIKCCNMCKGEFKPTDKIVSGLCAGCAEEMDRRQEEQEGKY